MAQDLLSELTQTLFRKEQLGRSSVHKPGLDLRKARSTCNNVPTDLKLRTHDGVKPAPREKNESWMCPNLPPNSSQTTSPVLGVIAIMLIDTWSSEVPGTSVKQTRGGAVCLSRSSTDSRSSTYL